MLIEWALNGLPPTCRVMGALSSVTLFDHQHWSNRDDTVGRYGKHRLPLIGPIRAWHWVASTSSFSLDTFPGGWPVVSGHLHLSLILIWQTLKFETKQVKRYGVRGDERLLAVPSPLPFTLSSLSWLTVCTCSAPHQLLLSDSLRCRCFVLKFKQFFSEFK